MYNKLLILLFKSFAIKEIKMSNHIGNLRFEKEKKIQITFLLYHPSQGKGSNQKNAPQKRSTDLKSSSSQDFRTGFT